MRTQYAWAFFSSTDAVIATGSTITPKMGIASLVGGMSLEALR